MADEEDVMFDRTSLLTNKVKTWEKNEGRLFKTLSLCAAFMGLGACISLPGPTLIDLREQVHTTVQYISYIFSGRSAGYLGGSILGGIMYDHMNHHLFLSVIMLLTAVATCLMPFVKKLWLLAFAMAAQGIAMGCLDTGGNALCLDIWGKHSGPYMQALHFAFGIGAFLAPLIVEPLLSHETNITHTVSILDKRPERAIDLETFQRYRRDGAPSIELTTSTIAPAIKKPKTSSENTEPKEADGTIADIKKKLMDSRDPETIVVPTVASTKPSNSTTKSTTTMALFTSPPVILESNASTTIAPTTPIKTSTTTTGTTSTQRSSVRSTTSRTRSIPADTKASTIKSSVPTTTPPHITTQHSSTSSQTHLSTSDVHTSQGPSNQILTSTTSVENLREESEDVNSNATVSSSNDTSAGDMKETNSSVSGKIKEMWKLIKNASKMQYAYVGLGIYLLLCSVLFLMTCCREYRHPSRVGAEELEVPHTRQDPWCFKLQLLALLFLFYALYVGLEISFGGLVTTFAYEDLDWPKPKAVQLVIVFYGALSAVRGLSICVSKVMTPSLMLVIDLGLAAFSVTLMMFFGAKYEIVMWLCTASYGMGMASIFPAGISWAENYIHLTGKATSVFVVGAALGEFAFPPVLGYFIKGHSMYFIYITCGANLVTCVVFVIMYRLASSRGERYLKLPKRLEFDNDETMEMDHFDSKDTHSLLPPSPGHSPAKKKVSFDMKRLKNGGKQD